ncbi:MAG TPA: hypothetical protein VFC53_01980 [Dehalococcoidia bacterium]|jgi:hypothetical protein|nr:hypothetical protein [Dehalococcoidia bacterium]
MTDDIGRGVMLLVVASAQGDAIEHALCERLRPEDVRRLHGGAWLAYGDVTPADVRDWLAPLLREDDSLFVVEYERWSSWGTAPAAHQGWLHRRGH